MEARQLLTGTFDLGGLIPLAALSGDMMAKMWTPTQHPSGSTIHQTTTTSGTGWTSTQVVNEDMVSTSSGSGAWDDHFSGTVTTTSRSSTTGSDGAVTTSDSTTTTTFDIHTWGTITYVTSTPGMPPMPMPGPWDYHSVVTVTVSRLDEVSGNGADDQTQTDTTQTTTQNGTVDTNGHDDGQMIYHADGTIHETYTNSVTDADSGDVQAENLTTHQHYIFDDTAGRGLSAGTGTMTASGDGYVHDILTETWGTVSLGTVGYNRTVFTDSDYQFNDTTGTGPEVWSITQNADQGQVTATSAVDVTDDGLTVNTTLNASETDIASVTCNSDGTGTVQVGETDSLTVHADIAGPDGASTTFDAFVGQVLGTSEILGQVQIFIGPSIEEGSYIRSMKQSGQAALPMHVISPAGTPADIRHSYWNYLATKWNAGLYGWPFTGTPGSITPGNGNIENIDTRPTTVGLFFANPKTPATGVVLNPYWTEYPVGPDWKYHLRVYARTFAMGIETSSADFDTGITSNSLP